MTRVRSLVAGVAGFLGSIVDSVRPTPGTTEGAVMVGMVLLAIGFAMAGLAPLSFIVPGALLVIVGIAPAFRRIS